MIDCNYEDALELLKNNYSLNIPTLITGLDGCGKKSLAHEVDNNFLDLFVETNMVYEDIPTQNNENLIVLNPINNINLVKRLIYEGHNIIIVSNNDLPELKTVEKIHLLIDPIGWIKWANLNGINIFIRMMILEYANHLFFNNDFSNVNPRIWTYLSDKLKTKGIFGKFTLLQKMIKMSLGEQVGQIFYNYILSNRNIKKAKSLLEKINNDFSINIFNEESEFKKLKLYGAYYIYNNISDEFYKNKFLESLIKYNDYVYINLTHLIKK